MVNSKNQLIKKRGGDVCIYVVCSLWCATEKTQHCKAITLQFENKNKTKQKNTPKRSSTGTALLELELDVISFFSCLFWLMFSLKSPNLDKTLTLLLLTPYGRQRTITLSTLYSTSLYNCSFIFSFNRKGTQCLLVALGGTEIDKT